MGNKIILPVAFSEPAQLVLFTRYGDPRNKGWEEKWMTDWNVKKHFPWFPATHLYLHRHFKTQLESAFHEMDILGLTEEIGTVKKCHQKNTDSRGVLSVHYWGAGIDLQPLHPTKPSKIWSSSFIEIMHENDIWCGQDLKKEKTNPYRFAMVVV